MLSPITVLLIGNAYAQDPVGNAFRNYCTILHAGCGAGGSFLAQLSVRSLEFFAVLIAGAAVLAIVYGAIRLITSAGNDQGKEEAKKIITTAVIGLLLALAAEAIILFVVKVIGSIPGT